MAVVRYKFLPSSLHLMDYGRIIDFQTEVAIGLAITGTLSAHFALYQRASKNGVNYARKSVQGTPYNGSV